MRRPTHHSLLWLMSAALCTNACGRFSHEEEEESLDPSTPASTTSNDESISMEGRTEPCARDILGTSPLAQACSDVTNPQLWHTLTDGFEFISVVSWVLATNGTDYQLFELGNCELIALQLPQEVLDRTLILTEPSENENLPGFLACSDDDCEFWVERPAFWLKNADGESQCRANGFEKRATFPAGTLTAARGSWATGANNTSNDQFCAWSYDEIFCSFAGVPTRIVSGVPVETLVLTEGACVVVNFLQGGTRTCFDGERWSDPEPSSLVPTGVNAQSACGGQTHLGALAGKDWWVTEDGRVLSEQPGSDECTTLSGPREGIVLSAAAPCACSVNPILLTRTQLYGSLDCVSCR